MTWADRRLTNLLGISHPIIQAPMVGPATPELVIAVSNAGALGSLGCAEMADAEIRHAVDQVRATGSKPFNLNFFAHPAPAVDTASWATARALLQPWYDELGLGPTAAAPPRLDLRFDDSKLALLLELRPPVVSFHFGVPDATSMAALKEAGIVILSTATTVAEARSLEKAGVDAVIAQGFEAGGHRGSHRPTAAQDGIGTLALVPQIVDAVDLPVIAAGGIADGRGIAAALALGASGVQIGTAFLRCPEAGTDRQRRALLARAADTDTMVTASFSGRAARARRSRYALAMAPHHHALPAFPTMYELSDPLAAQGQTEEASFHLYGQAAALARAIPAGRLVAELVAETRAILTGLASGAMDIAAGT